MERQCSYPRSLTDVVLKKPRSKACREKLAESVVPFPSIIIQNKYKIALLNYKHSNICHLNIDYGPHKVTLRFCGKESCV